MFQHLSKNEFFLYFFGYITSCQQFFHGFPRRVFISTECQFLISMTSYFVLLHLASSFFTFSWSKKILSRNSFLCFLDLCLLLAFWWEGPATSALTWRLFGGVSSISGLSEFPLCFLVCAFPCLLLPRFSNLSVPSRIKISNFYFSVLLSFIVTIPLFSFHLFMYFRIVPIFSLTLFIRSLFFSLAFHLSTSVEFSFFFFGHNESKNTL